MKRGAVMLAFLHPGSQSSVFARCYTDLLFYDATHERRIVGHEFGELGLQAHSAKIHTARNEVAEAFLDKSEAEWLVFIDSDMGFAPDTVDRLVAAADRYTRPIVGGLCFGVKSDGQGEFHARRFRIQPTLYLMFENDAEVGFIPVFNYPRDQVVEVDATGAACFIVHRSVLEKIRAEHGDRWFTPLSLPKGEGGFTEFSEDMSFFLRAKAAGFKTHVHTGIKTTHDKGAIFLDEETFDVQQAWLSLFPKADRL